MRQDIHEDLKNMKNGGFYPMDESDIMISLRNLELREKPKGADM